MEREIKFKRVHFFDEEKTKFSHFSEWGVNIGYGSVFNSPSTNNFALYFTDIQYTGLKDKNGKEIYDKDILERIILSSDKKTEYKDYAYVFFKDGAFLLRWNDNAETKISGFVNQMTVIGNPYENPELIK